LYKWRHGDPSARHARRATLKVEIARLFAAHRGTYGSPRIAADLRAAGWRISENTVAQLIRELGLAARRRRNRNQTTRQGRGRWRAPDLIGRDFGTDRLNRKWYGDGTQIPTEQGKLYLDSVLDMGSRRIVGFALGEHHDADLAQAALQMAVAVRGGKDALTQVLMHTDQGSEAFRISLARRSSAFSRFNALICSCSAVVNPGRPPESTSARRTHLRSVSVEPMPSLAATERIASYSDRYSSRCSSTSRTARCRNSGEKRRWTSHDLHPSNGSGLRTSRDASVEGVHRVDDGYAGVVSQLFGKLPQPEDVQMQHIGSASSRLAEDSARRRRPTWRR
jgi:hypothetical protein